MGAAPAGLAPPIAPAESAATPTTDSRALLAAAFAAHHGLLCGYLARRLVRRSPWGAGPVDPACEAADLAQDVFVRAWLSLGRSGAHLSGPGAAAGYLFCTARTLCIDLARHRRLVPMAALDPGLHGAALADPDSAADPERVALSHEAVEHARRAVASAPPGERLSLAALLAEGWPDRAGGQNRYAAAGRRIGLTAGGVKGAIFRLRVRLAAVGREAGP